MKPSNKIESIKNESQKQISLSEYKTMVGPKLYRIAEVKVQYCGYYAMIWDGVKIFIQ